MTYVYLLNWIGTVTEQIQIQPLWKAGHACNRWPRKFTTVSMHFVLSCLLVPRPLYMLLNSWCSWRLGFHLSWWQLPVSIHFLYSDANHKSKLIWGQFLKRINVHFPILGYSWGFIALLSSFTAWLKDISSVLRNKCFVPLYSSTDTCRGLSSSCHLL